VWTERTVVEC